MPKIALLLGSTRTGGNTPGIASWVARILQAYLDATAPSSGSPTWELVIVNPSAAPLPLGTLTDAQMPAEIRDPAQYASPAVREWSAFVSSCDALVVVTPQYNWGVPGELKNSFDHLYWEWRDKPVMLVTFGGHGGSRCAAHLRDILGGGLKMRVLEKGVQVMLPTEFIRGTQRVTASEDGAAPEFLAAYEEPLKEAADELAKLFAAAK